jgi:hypothetical protein
MRCLHTHRPILPLAITVMVGGALISNTIHAQAGPQSKILHPAMVAARVHVIEGPALELVRDNWAIIRWKSNNPGGSDEHFSVVHYGTDREHLSLMAKSHIRLNQNHTYTVFRVRVVGLKPQTTYYYTVDSMQGNGRSDNVKSAIAHFTTPPSPHTD